jgi:hypothetical protein
VNEKVKEGSILSSLQYGVGNVSTKLTDVSSKAWTNINSLWGGEQVALTNSSSSSGLFGRSGYNSVPGETGSPYQSNYDNNNYTNNYSDTNRSSQNESDMFHRSSSGSNLNSKNSKPSSKPKDDWDWEDNTWENDTSTSNTKAASQTKSSNSSNNNPKSSSDKSTKTPPKKDLINFEDDNWEPIEPFKSK